jgi:putative transposase
MNDGKYRRGYHNKYRLMVHLIFVVKYRKRLFVTENVVDDLKQSLHDISEAKGWKILEMETDKDHIHILLDYKVTDCVSDIVKILKMVSTNMIWKNYPRMMKRNFWREHTLWSDGYFACSIGEASKETIEQYIQNQG